MLPIDNDEHVREVVNDPKMRRAVTLITKELPLEKSKNRIMMIRKFLFADSYLLIRTLKPVLARQTKMFQLPCSLTPLLHDIYEEVVRDSVSKDEISNAEDFIHKFR